MSWGMCCPALSAEMFMSVWCEFDKSDPRGSPLGRLVAWAVLALQMCWGRGWCCIWAASWVPVPCQPSQSAFPELKGRSWPRALPSAFGPCVLGVSALLLEAVWLMVKQTVASCLPHCTDASLLGGGMPFTRVASQLMCLVCSWLLLLTFSRSLLPLLGQCPDVTAVPLVAVGTLLGDRSSSALWAPLSASLDSSPAFPLLFSPPVPQGIFVSELLVDITG